MFFENSYSIDITMKKKLNLLWERDFWYTKNLKFRKEH